MTPTPPVPLLPGIPLRDRLDALPAEELAWLLPWSLWEPPPPSLSGVSCRGGQRGGGGGTFGLGPFSPASFASAVCRERVMTTTAIGHPFLVLAGVTLFLPHAVATGSGALLGASVSDWSANRMDAVGPGLPSCVSIVQRGVLAEGGRGIVFSTELGEGTHVLMEFFRPVAKRGGGDGDNVDGGNSDDRDGGGGGDVLGGPSIEIEFAVIRRPRVAGEAAAVVLHKLGILHTIPEASSSATAATAAAASAAAAGAVVGAPAVPPLFAAMRDGAAGAAAVEAHLKALCADGLHIGALVDLAEPPPRPPRLVGEAVVGPSSPSVLPYTITSSRCSVYATVRLRSLALQLVPLVVPSARPLRMGTGGKSPACRRRLLPIAPATTSPAATSASGDDVRMAVSSDNSGGGIGSGGSGGCGGNGVSGDRGGSRRRPPRRAATRPSPPHPATAVAIAPAADAAGLAAAVAAAAESAMEAASAGEAVSSRVLAAATTLLPPPRPGGLLPVAGGSPLGASVPGGGGDGGDSGGSGCPPRRVRRRRLGSIPPPGVDGSSEAWARVLRNREAARRSNEKRRLRRLATAAAAADGTTTTTITTTMTTTTTSNLGAAAATILTAEPMEGTEDAAPAAATAAAAPGSPLSLLRLTLPCVAEAPPPASAWVWGGDPSAGGASGGDA